MDIFRPQLLSQDRRGPSPTSKMSQPSEKIDYLDVRVFKGSDGLLCTDIFRKDPAVNSILSAKSSHPKQIWLFFSWTYGKVQQSTIEKRNRPDLGILRVSHACEKNIMKYNCLFYLIIAIACLPLCIPL
ncbi:uncharacterized protein ACNLHF_024544 isoform 1-T2 [Anomaloglossus baeobatrachus]